MNYYAESGCLCSGEGEGEGSLKTMKYRRLNTDFVSTDPFTGLYLAAFGSHGPEVLQLQREPDAVDVRSPPCLPSSCIVFTFACIAFTLASIASTLAGVLVLPALQSVLGAVMCCFGTHMPTCMSSS